MRPERAALLGMSGALALAVFGCSKAPRPWLERAEVAFEGEDDEPLLATTPDAAKAQWVSLLTSAGFQTLSEGKKAPEGATLWRLSLALAVEPPNSRSARVRVEGVVELKTRGEGMLHQLQVSAEQTPSSDGLEEQREAAKGALARTLKDAATSAALVLALSAKSDTEVVAALGSSSPRESELALEVLAERKHPAAVEPLLKKLQSDDLDVARRAVGGLVLIGDRRAVPALIEASRAKDFTFQREMIFALSSLGGDEALAYLSLMAEGHDDALMRASAKAALEEMSARRDGGQKGSP